MDKLLAFGLCITLIAGVASGQSSDLPSIQLTEYRLKNGLTVVLHEDHSTPMVSLNVLYKVGSRDEAPGKTGLAHLFEHLMFMGSKNHAYRAAAEELGGGVAAGYTTRDKTVYYSNVPSNYLERILYLEADRMGGFLEILDQSKLDYQRDVVRNERRQHMDNVAHGTVSERLNSVVFPKGHPYHHDIIGSMDDLAAASLDDVSSFFRQHYVPNNAVLSIAGDFEPKQARAWIEQYFGRIAPGTVRRRSSALPRFAGPMRSSYEDRFARDHQIAIAWPAPRAYSPDEAPLQILARILSYDRNSRLNDVLVNKVGLASEVLVRTFSGDLGGFFQIFATARSNRSVEDIEKEIEKEIERIKLDGVSAGEVNRAIATYESSRLDGLQMGWAKGDMIAHYAAAVGRANYLGPDLERFRRVTAADVKRVANRYLIANRFVLSAVPAKSPPTGMRVDPPTNTRVREIDPAVRAKQEAMLPKPGPEPKLVLPPVEKTRLSNGLEVWIVQRRVLPLVTMNLVIHAGASADDVGREGLAAMTSLMIPLGTESRSAKELSDGFQSVGAYFDSYTGGWDSSGLWLQSTKKNLDQALGYYADVIINPRFSEAEFRPLQERTLETLRQPLIGIQILDKVLYVDHRYGRLPGGSERSVAAMTREDVRRFYHKHFRPNNATLIVVGDVQPSDLVPRLEKALSEWKPAEIVAAQTLVQVPDPKPGIYLVDRPGTVQSAIAIGQVGVERSTPDFAALQVMNAVLSLRITRNIRGDKGYAYRAGSSFSFRKGAGPFLASAEVQSVSTKAAVQEFLKELNDIRGGRPITARELTGRKQSLVQTFARDFETVQGVASRLAEPAVHRLPANYFNEFIPNIAAVTAEDAHRVANKYLDPSKMTIVIVGDRKTLEPQLRELGIPIFFVDTRGNLLAR